MSASSKPPRSFSTKPPTPERVARALLDAELFGDKAAADKHEVHYKTISNWRRAYRDDPAVVAERNRLRRVVREGWIDEARDARRLLVARTIELAATSRNLTAVTNATRRMHEIVLSHEILNDPDDDDQHHLADQPEDPREDETSDDAEGGGEVLED